MHPNIEELAKETMALDIEDRAFLRMRCLAALFPSCREGRVLARGG